MDDTRKYLALIVTVMSFIFLGGILWISQDQKEIVFAMLTGTLGVMNALVSFYFGSSEGSQKKTNIIKDLTEKAEGSEVREEIAQVKKVAVEADNQERKEAVEVANQERKEAKETIENRSSEQATTL